MITLSIRYTIDARKRQEFEHYARALGGIIPRCGGELVGYWLPTKFAGPTNSALALIDFPSLAAYEQYRERLAKDTANVDSVRTSRRERLHPCRGSGDPGARLASRRAALARRPRTDRALEHMYQGWKVVGCAFLIAVFGWGFGFYGIGVFLACWSERHGWATSAVRLGGHGALPGLGAALDRLHRERVRALRPAPGWSWSASRRWGQPSSG